MPLLFSYLILNEFLMRLIEAIVDSWLDILKQWVGQNSQFVIIRMYQTFEKCGGTNRLRHTQCN